ncbi:restriction endonuclease subunit S [Methylomonas sp. SURF-2]|uniref:Restriction endonuclease subunit S n=1 Tax=Methylomonas subterranea TaxID=2952225 RepID=A0ABT1TIL1_9GAMM|nr:restriction endonuclease subunit S [Methylomonas sp. SURF-2]MCQ8105299.1 restriction endonuclease subunit S [Methylomonas sp. SURF-2]
MTTSNQIAEASVKYLEEGAGQVVPAGYKKTEVGVIPLDWQATSLGEISEVRMCKRILAWQTRKIGEIPFFKIGTFGSQPDAFIPTSLYDEFKAKYYFPNKGDILISAAGTLGKSVIYDGEPAYFQDSNIVWLEIDKGKLLNDYLFHYYKLIKWASSEGSTIARLYNGIIRASVIALPSTQEQAAIANALSDVDALINELEKLIAKKQAIKTATMQQLLTGRTRLPPFALREDGTLKGYKQSELGDIPEDWETVRFGDIAYIRNDRVNPRVTGCGEWCVELEHINSADGTLNGSTVTSIQSSLKNKFSQGDVLFGKLRSYLRKYWLADRTGVCSTEIWVLQPIGERAISRYVYDLVTTDSFIEAASEAYGTHMPRSDWKVIKEFALTIPCVEEQTAIATILSDMDNEIQTLQQRLSKTRQIKQGMMQELLTGRIRLVNGELKMENG